MAKIAVNPFVLKDVVFEVGADDYAAHVSQVEFTPDAATITWKGLSPDAVFTDVATPTWTCTVSYIQDWTPTGFSTYLFNHVGESVEVTFKPVSGSGPSFTAEIILTSGVIGGSIEQYAAASVTLGVKGRPVLVPAA